MLKLHSPAANFLPGDANISDRFYVTDSSKMNPLTGNATVVLVATKERCEQFIKARS